MNSRLFSREQRRSLGFQGHDLSPSPLTRPKELYAIGEDPEASNHSTVPLGVPLACVALMIE